jgi:hypothetical protein
LRGSRQLKGRKAALVLVAVEKRGRGTGRARMTVIPDFKSTTLIAFLKQNVAAGSNGIHRRTQELHRIARSVTGTYLAANPCELNCGKAPSR